MKSNLKKSRLVLKNQHGFGILEVLVAAGFLALLSVGTMTLLENSQKSQRGVQAKDEQRDVISEIRTLLNSRTACLNTFGAINVTAPGAITAIKDAANVDKYVVNAVTRSPLLRYSGFAFSGFTADAGFPNRGNANLVVTLAKTANVSGVQELRQSIALRVITNASNVVTDCYSLASTSEGAWQPDPANSSSILYAGGNVGIGALSPGTALDIDGAISMRGIAAAPAVAPVGQGRIYFDSASNKMKISENGGAYDTMGGLWKNNGPVPNSIYYSGGKVAVGSNSPEAMFDVQNIITASQAARAIGSKSEIRVTGNGLTMGTIVGNLSSAYDATTGSTHDMIFGSQTYAESDSGNVNYMTGSYIETQQGANVGSITGLEIRHQKWAGTTTNRYGIYLTAPLDTSGAPPTNEWGIYQQGNQKNYFAGNVGIGTTSPGQMLDVAGNIRSTGTLEMTGSNPRVYLTDNITSANSILAGGTPVGENFLIGRTSPLQSIIGTYSSGGAGFHGMITDPADQYSSFTGFTYKPTNPWDTIGASSGGFWYRDGYIRMLSFSKVTARFEDTTNTFYGYSNTATLAPEIIFARKRGTYTAQASAQAGDTLGILGFKADVNDGNPVTGSITASVDTGLILTYYPTRIDFNTSPGLNTPPESRMTVLANGNVGVGTTTPGARLDVADTGTTTSAIIVPRAGNFTGTTVNGMIRYNTISTLFEFYQNGAWVNYMTAVSDGRLKTNVVPVTDALDIVNQLNPVFYDWDRSNPKASGFADKHQVGFIAQEVEKVLPEVVNKGEDSYRSLEYGKIVSIVVAAVKELYAEVIGHDEKIQTLDRQIASKADKAEVGQLKHENAAKDRKIKELEQRLDKIERLLNSK